MMEWCGRLVDRDYSGPVKRRGLNWSLHKTIAVVNAIGSVGISLRAVIACWLLAGCSDDLPIPQEVQVLDLRPYADLGGNFALTDQRGEAFEITDLRGRTTLLFFGYTYCPDFCPSTLSRLVQVYEQVDDKNLATVFISVDGERDTPEVLRVYLEYFPNETIGLTGSRVAVDQVVELYGAEYEIKARDDAQYYQVYHSTDVYLLDEEGRVRFLFDADYGPEDMAEVINALHERPALVEMRRMADDVPLVVLDLESYECGPWGRGPKDYNFWNVNKEGLGQKGEATVQPN
jgi:protein SCO1